MVKDLALVGALVVVAAALALFFVLVLLWGLTG